MRSLKLFELEWTAVNLVKSSSSSYAYCNHNLTFRVLRIDLILRGALLRRRVIARAAFIVRVVLGVCFVICCVCRTLLALVKLMVLFCVVLRLRCRRSRLRRLCGLRRLGLLLRVFVWALLWRRVWPFASP